MLDKLFEIIFSVPEKEKSYIQSEIWSSNIDNAEIINTIASFDDKKILHSFLFLSRCIFAFMKEDDFFNKLTKKDLEKINYYEFVDFLEGILSYEYENSILKKLH